MLSGQNNKNISQIVYGLYIQTYFLTYNRSGLSINHTKWPTLL